MKKLVLSLCLLSATALPSLAQEAADTVDSCEAQENFSIIVHGGTSSGEVRQDRLDFITEMLAERRTELEAGATALDMVEASIVAMEDSGLFNAGKAAITNSQGYVETDASIMDGRNLDAGSVASQLTIKNPIRAARLVMEETRHVMMVGDRGEEAVIGLGAETVEPGMYFTRMCAIEPPAQAEPKEHGTVGAAVLDRCGNLAAGTSTGGYDSKIPGRVGDSPIIGAGVYAKNGVMAGSATGHGEYFIRHTAIRTAAARMEYGGESLNKAVSTVIGDMHAAGPGRDGRGGIIAVDADGNFAFPHSYPGMIHGYTSEDMEPTASQLGSFVSVAPVLSED